jgi:hypothetical protein
MVPGRPKRPGHLLPTQPLRPARQKPGIGFGQLMLARCPGHSLNPNTTAPAAHPARGVDEKHLDTPHRDKLKAAHRQRVVAWPSAAAARADGPAIGPGAQLCLNRRFAGVFHPAHRAVHKRFEILHAIQDSLDVHPVVLPLSGAWSHSYHYRVRGQDALSPVQPAFSRIPVMPGYFLPTNFPEEPKFDVIRFELQTIQDELLTILTSDQNKPVTDYTIHLTAMSYLQQHAYLTGVAQSPDFRPLFIDHIYESRRLIERKFETFTGQNIYDEQFRLGGIAAVILCWIERGMEESPETISTVLTRECACALLNQQK